MTTVTTGGHPDLKLVNPRAAAIDIGSTMHMAAVNPDCDDMPVRAFGTFTRDLHDLANWFRSCGVMSVAMESTGVYWVPAFEVLEQHGFEVILVNARYAKNVPGRKTDVSDAGWLRQLHSYGLLRGSFRPAAEIVTLRAYLRQRERLVEYAAAHIQHMQKALMEMNLQLHHVVSDITGATGMRIIRAIAAGERDPDVLASFRDIRCHSSVETIRASLVGNDRDEHVFALTQSLELYDFYQAKILDCDRRLEAAVSRLTVSAAGPVGKLPKARHRQKPNGAPAFDVRAALYGVLGVDLTQIHGLGPSLALKLIAECGTDLKAWPSAKHFTSWLCLAWEQDLRREAAVVTNPEIIEPRSRPPTAGGDHDRAQRHRPRGLLPPPIIADREAKGGHGHRPQDRRSVLQHSSLRHDLSRSRCGGL
jgi:transposase